ncbi:uncharacterized protein T551_00554 [Pneumocystis jirovecii RU7]|uniref:Uncharacterized protein n=1 Tax=Pneumocystis jirovecii (strain RU7) TaxID=1408657 RepID=A0A0W4ZVS7_PNEJ7|nr:uncharacterized protein T551_00554 [Pneumocystis jirovecii RU7]KTW32464.1 hypothetical protein T551_00554 [Pneumocystis jirovecii RU7]
MYKAEAGLQGNGCIVAGDQVEIVPPGKGTEGENKKENIVKKVVEEIFAVKKDPERRRAAKRPLGEESGNKEAEKEKKPNKAIPCEINAAPSRISTQ